MVFGQMHYSGYFQDSYPTPSGPSAPTSTRQTMHVLATQALNISLYSFLLYFSLLVSPLYISLYMSCFLWLTSGIASSMYLYALFQISSQLNNSGIFGVHFCPPGTCLTHGAANPYRAADHYRLRYPPRGRVGRWSRSLFQLPFYQVSPSYFSPFFLSFSCRPPVEDLFTLMYIAVQGGAGRSD